LRYAPYDDAAQFRSQVRDAIAADPARGYQELAEVLRRVLLRRTKATKLNGRAVVALPKRELRTVEVKLSRDEAAFYEQVRLCCCCCCRCCYSACVWASTCQPNSWRNRHSKRHSAAAV
jgi:hypothetical protein